MKCEICGRGLDNKKYVVFECRGHETGKIVLCKACMSVGYMTKGNPVVYYDKVQKKAVTLETPEFVYFTGGSKMRDKVSWIAKECDWQVVRFAKPRDGVEYVSEIFDQAVIHRYFDLMVPGTWFKDASRTRDECFRKSCINIRTNYLGWVLRDKK